LRAKSSPLSSGPPTQRQPEKLESHLRTAQADGELSASADPKALAHYFAAVKQGTSQQARGGPTHTTLTYIADQAIRT